MNNKNHNKLANENPTNSTNTTSIPRSDHNITTTTNPWTSTITPPLANSVPFESDPSLSSPISSPLPSQATLNVFSGSTFLPSTLSTSSPTSIQSTENTPTSNSTNNAQQIIPSGQRLTTGVALAIIFIIFLGALLAVYVRIRRKKHRQQLLSSAISVAEGGISAPETGMSESYQNQQPTSTPSPTPLPPPQPLPSPPSPLSTIDSFSTRGSGSLSSPRYQVSTLQIEPMTRRVTLNLGERGRNIVLRNTDGSGTDHVVNVISIQEEDENESDGLSSSFKKKVMFWRGP